MTDPFLQAAKVLAASQLGASAVYWVGGVDPLPDPVRVVVRRGDPTASLFGGQVLVDTARLDILADQVAQPMEGDTVEVGAVLYTLRGDPVYDAVMGFWTCETNGGKVA